MSKYPFVKSVRVCGCVCVCKTGHNIEKHSDSDLSKISHINNAGE